MLKLLKFLGALAVVTSSIGHANAASITEDLALFAEGSQSYSLFDVSFGPTSSLGTSLISFTGGGPYAASSSPIPIFSQNVSLNIGESYTLSFESTYGGGVMGSTSFNVSGSPQALSAGVQLDPTTFSPLFFVSASVSPVPLPTSFPLFVMALIGLGMVGYYTTRANSRFAV
jgi:hypothetical protein